MANITPVTNATTFFGWAERCNSLISRLNSIMSRSHQVVANTMWVKTLLKPSGNTDFSNTTIITVGSASKLRITGGTTGQFLKLANSSTGSVEFASVPASFSTLSGKIANSQFQGSTLLDGALTIRANTSFSGSNTNINGRRIIVSANTDLTGNVVVSKYIRIPLGGFKVLGIANTRTFRVKNSVTGELEGVVLGTMSQQAATAVAIVGGTINNTTQANNTLSSGTVTGATQNDIRLGSSSIAAAATTDLGSVIGAVVAVTTGASTITSLGSSAATGSLKLVRASTAFTLVRGVNVKINTGANLKVEVDDYFLAHHEGGGVWNVFTPPMTSIFPAGTTLPFYQQSAPTGWNKLTSLNDAAIRIVSGSTGGTTGGSTEFSTIFSASRTPAGSVSSPASTSVTTSISGSVAAHAITQAELPVIQPTAPTITSGSGIGIITGFLWNIDGGATSGPQPISTLGSGSAHSHGASGLSASSPASTTVTSTFTGTAMNFNVLYANVILASKN